MSDNNAVSHISIISADLFRAGLSPRHALAVATAWVVAATKEDMLASLGQCLVNAKVDGEHVEVDGEQVARALTTAGYLDGDLLGSRWEEVKASKKEASFPIEATEFNTDKDGNAMVMGRKRGYAPNTVSPLAKEAFHALEATQYTVDSWVLEIAEQVNAILKEKDVDYRDPEGFVLSGCTAMDSKKGYFSEFFGDRRLRLYQEASHGPNGQASDRSRALMDLFGVSQDYNIAEAMAHIRAEMQDMVDTKDPEAKKALSRAARTNPVQFVLDHIEGDNGCSKPWSFIKAVRIMAQLQQGKRPYIGMAIGLDAKCSGPQLASLMSGDMDIMAACGFTNQAMDSVDDAYVLCCAHLHAAGFSTAITRKVIKKSFMGIFYGQGIGAFMTHEGISGDSQAITEELFNLIHPNEVKEENAKKFHGVVSQCFGKQTAIIRSIIKSMHNKLEGKPSYLMPDGSEVKMDYRVRVNVAGDVVSFDTPATDVTLECDDLQLEINSYSLKTKQADANNFVRTGFVNMIQATDALLARLIIVHLHRAGVKHIICVHDCFRVSIGDMPKLQAAIKQAYLDLFGCPVDMPTKDLPEGTDILGLFFKGFKANALPGNDINSQSQFRSNGRRITQRINGLPLDKLVNSLGEKDGAWFFSK